MKRKIVLLTIVVLSPSLLLAQDQTVNSIGMKLVPISPGSFLMGSKDGDFDERPVHSVEITQPFHIATTEVTNAQYEQFDSTHRRYRGKNGFSSQDDDAVIYVSWEDAIAFCKWLSNKEGRTYRLPTEAEWEYACRSGSTAPFYYGATVPKGFHKSQEDQTEAEPVTLRVGQTPPNDWGLFDMHGNVEEWCFDWYGPYDSVGQADPAGPTFGDFKVTRGGSHNTDLRFLRSANRMGALPQDKHWLIGFRVVVSDASPAPETYHLEVPLWASHVSQESHDWSGGPNKDLPSFFGPRAYVKIPKGSNGPMFSAHNHDPGLAYCPNGDLLAIWYSCNREPGRELAILASRLRHGSDEWDAAAPFWDAPDRNDHAPALWFNGQDTIYHFNGLSAGPAYRQNLALIMRTSKDNGVNWSKARLINPERGLPSQPVTTVFRTSDGSILLPSDAPWLLRGGATALWKSSDNGEKWTLLSGAIGGIHAGVTQLTDGRLISFGRWKSPLDESTEPMPYSISDDMGKTWSVSESSFPPISGGQRLVLMRLREGPILLVSFSDFRPAKEPNPKGITVRDSDGKPRQTFGMYAALSFDEGLSWPTRKLITPGGALQELDGGAHTDNFSMDETHAEPAGYLAATQTPDGMIHLISSRLYYRFNLAWLEKPIPAKE